MTALQHLAWGAARTAPTWRAAWSDRSAALMAGLCQFASCDLGVVEAELCVAGFTLADLHGRWILAAQVLRGDEEAADWRLVMNSIAALLQTEKRPPR